MSVRLEVCVDSLESAVAAQEGGADRVELCSALSEGGLTPSLGLIEAVRAALSLPIHLMIRPRAGGFGYSATEIALMQRDIQLAKATGCDGVVLGVLRPDGRVDEARTRQLLEAAHPLSVTFHRAFDLTPNPLEALQVLIRLGLDRVLTSGQAATALEGLDCIAKLVEAARGRISIMPGGRVEQGLEAILRGSGAKEVHLSARKRLPGSGRSALEGHFGPHSVADRERIAQIKAALAQL